MLFAHWEAIGEYNVFFEMDKGSTDKATMHLPASYDPYKGVQVKQGGFVAVDQAPTFSQNDIQQAAGYFLSYWSYIIEHEDGSTETGVTTDVKKIAITGKTTFSAHFAPDHVFVVIYEPGTHGTFPSTQDKTFFVNLDPHSTRPTFGGQAAGTQLDPDYFDTATSNPKNIDNPKGIPGYEFIGWHWTTTDENNVVTHHFSFNTEYEGVTYTAEALPSEVDRNYVFEAWWQPSEVTVYLSPNGGEWILDSNGQLVNPDAAGDFVLERGQSFAMLTQYCGQIVELPSADKIMQRVGWRFVGWTDSAWEAVKWQPGETLLAYYGLRIYAVWQRLTYNVSFNSNGGTPVSDKKGIGWSDRNVLAGVDTPTKVGYEFDGWYIVNPYSDRFDDSIDKVSNNTTYADLARYNGLTDETALANGIILYAKWLEKQATIYYRPVVMDAQGRFVKTTGGSLTVSSENIYAISTLTAPRGSQASSNTGYHFLGWYDAQGNLLSRSEKYIPTKSEYNLTGQYWGDANHSVYYALFEPNSYTIEFINNGGIGRIEAITVKYDEYRNLPVNDGQMARVGYGFAGWSTAADGSGMHYGDGAQVHNLSSINGAVISLYAVWQGNVFTLTLDPNGGSPNSWDNVAKPPVTYSGSQVTYHMGAGSSTICPIPSPSYALLHHGWLGG